MTPHSDHPTQDECQIALDQLNAFLDHELGDSASDEIREHLNLCEQCLDQYDMTQMVKDLVKQHCGMPAPQDLRNKVLRSLQVAAERHETA